MYTEPDPSAMVKVFISYSHNDAEHLNNIKSHLLPSKDILDVWADHRVEPGEKWDDKIEKELRQAHIILFLVSNNLFESKYIIEKELAIACERHEEGSAEIIPVLLSRCDWHLTKLGNFQALPIRDNQLKSIEEWDIKNNAYHSIAVEIRRKASKIIMSRKRRDNNEKLQTFTEKCQEYLRKSPDEKLSVAEMYSLRDLAADLGISKIEADKALTKVNLQVRALKEKYKRYLETVEKYLSAKKDLDTEQTKKELGDRKLFLELENDDIRYLQPEIEKLVKKYEKWPENPPIKPWQPSWLLVGLVLLLFGIFWGAKLLKTSESKTNYKTCNHPGRDNISKGEEIFTPVTSSTKENESETESSAKKCEPSHILDKYKSEWNNIQEKAMLPEQLIYINNAILERDYKPSDYYTIAVAISVPEADKNSTKNTDKNYKIDFAREILRGVAQLQTKINLGFLESKGNQELLNLLKPKNNISIPPEFIIKNGIEGIKSKGVMVLVINDADNEGKAEEVAKNISQRYEVMGIIGHYASKISKKTVNIYASNDLAMISPGSTASYFTANHHGNFFRTVFPVNVQAHEIANFFKHQKINRATSFFSESDETFSQAFKIEFETAFQSGDNKGTILDVKNRSSLGSLGNLESNSVVYENIKNQLKSKMIDGIVVIPSPLDDSPTNDAITLMTNIEAKKIVGAWKLRDHKTLEKLSGTLTDRSLDNIVFAVPWDHNNKNQASQDFLKDANFIWKTKELSPTTATAYDATKVLVHALKKLGLKAENEQKRKDVINILHDVGFIVKDGVTGPIKFDGTGGDRKITIEEPNKVTKVDPVVFVHVVRCKGKGKFFPITEKSPCN